MKVLVTGGAGFIGSHLVDALIALHEEVVVLDNLSSGRRDNLRQLLDEPAFKLVEGDLKNFERWNEVLSGVTLVYHLAANPEVRVGEVEPSVHFQENLVATFRLLEAMRRSPETKCVVFASTSTVYGEASQLPTPEDYGPLLPISTYGATKLGCEVLLSSYAYTHGIRALILRLGNCVGSRARHGVVVDFIEKLKTKPDSLEILGDGTQKKSYVHIDDCVDATVLAKNHFLASQQRVDLYNLSSPDQVSVKRVAEVVAEEMGAKGVKMNFTGGIDGGRGWLGDVKVMHLSIEKLQKLGWTPKLNSEGAVRKAARELLA
jgi:UDP-glucose 4-epimerase